MTRLTGVVAMGPDRVIGKDGGLPWHLPEDLAFFRKTTSGHAVVMGRKTFESIGRPLPKRRNIVLTRDRRWEAEGVEVIHSPEELSGLEGLGERVYVIGGAEIYRAFFPLMEDLLVSHVKAEFAGDTWFPEYRGEFPNASEVADYEGFRVVRWGRL